MPMTDGGMKQVSCAKRSFIPNPLPSPPAPSPVSFFHCPPPLLPLPTTPPLPSFAPAALLPPFITAPRRPLLYSYFPLFLSPMSISPTLLYSLLFSLSVFLLLFYVLFPHPFCGPFHPIPTLYSLQLSSPSPYHSILFCLQSFRPFLSLFLCYSTLSTPLLPVMPP